MIQANMGAGVLLVTGMLVQRSALSVGGTSHPAAVDDAFCRDGLGRPTLRASGIAGALFASLRRTGYTAPASFTQCIADNGRADLLTSVLRFWHSHPVPCWHLGGAAAPQMQPRQSVAIRQDTAAAAHGALFDQEVLPPGHEWPLVIEFDLTAYAQWLKDEGNGQGAIGQTHLPTASEALALLCTALGEWQQQRCWMGRRVARGQGWMDLQGLTIHHVPDPCCMTWANHALWAEQQGETAQRTRWADFRAKATLCRTEVLPPGQVPLPAAVPWHYRRLRGTCTAGLRDNGWVWTPGCRRGTKPTCWGESSLPTGYKGQPSKCPPALSAPMSLTVAWH